MAYAVNSKGQVVGGAVNTVPDSNSVCLDGGNCYYFPPFPAQVRAFLWQDGVMQDLGTLGGTDALATLINERGQVVGESYTSSAAGGCGAPGGGFALATGAFMWDKENGMRDLGNFGGTCTFAFDLNSQGQVVGTATLPGDSFQHAFLWERGKIHDLGGGPGGDIASASAINDHGQAVGFGFLAGDVFFHAVLWNRVRQITDLGVIGSDTCSFASSINAQGQVVGDSKPGCGPDSDRSFLWEDGSIIDLNTLIPSGSPLYLQFTDTINDRGEITGNGSDASGNSHAFLLIPCDESHPNVEGCDYSLVDASAASSQPIDSAPSTRGTRTSPPRTNHQFRFPRRMTRTEGGTQ
jgi:probable HAF family extracellular repeat protein